MLTATRWTRYVNDRLYVIDGPDMRVGWVDHKTGATVLERGEYASEFNSILPGRPPTATGCCIRDNAGVDGRPVAEQGWRVGQGEGR